MTPKKITGTKSISADLYEETALKGGALSIPTTNIKLWIDPNNGKYLGKYDEYEIKDMVGVVTGLAWTSVGGDILYIESVLTPGKGLLNLTGNLGDVMKESAKTAISYVRSRANDWHIDGDFYKNKDIHIHYSYQQSWLAIRDLHYTTTIPF